MDLNFIFVVIKGCTIYNLFLVVKDFFLWAIIVFSMYIFLYGFSDPTINKVLWSLLAYFIMFGLILIYIFWIVPDKFSPQVNVPKISPIAMAEDVMFFILTMVLLLFMMTMGKTEVTETVLILSTSTASILMSKEITLDDLSFAFTFGGLVTLTYSMVNNFKLYFNPHFLIRTMGFNMILALFIYKFTASEIGQAVNLVVKHPDATMLGMMIISLFFILGNKEKNPIKEYLANLVLKNIKRIFIGSITIYITTIIVTNIDIIK